MNTKEIVKTIENLTGLCFEISINDNQTEVTSTFNPEKINYEYFNVCDELESYFTELYLDSNNLILERILYLLNDGLKLWNRLKKESFNINLNFENKELKNLETELTDAELLRVAEIKIYYIQNLISKIENLTGSPKAKALPPQPIIKQKPIKYGANEYALTYIFDLYAIGQQVPINRIEGSFDAKKIKQDASKFPMYDKAPDTFYRAVKSVLEYDLNKPTDLQNISKDWLNAVRNLSTNWAITEQYLKDKNLIGE